jgi:hypothetical protein
MTFKRTTPITALDLDPTDTPRGNGVFKGCSKKSAARWLDGDPKLANHPANAKVVFCGDSTSDGATGAGVMLRRVMALHAQAGESLHGMATDYYTDGVTTNGSNVLTQPSTQTGIPVGHSC